MSVRCPRNDKLYDVPSHNSCPNPVCVQARQVKKNNQPPAAPLKGATTQQTQTKAPVTDTQQTGDDSKTSSAT